MRPLTKAWKLVVTGSCSGQPQHSHLTCTDARCTSPGLGASTRHSPLAQRLRDVPTGRHPISSQGLRAAALVWFSATTLLPLLCLSHLSPELPHQPSTQAQPPLCGLQADGTLGGHHLERSSLLLAPDPTLSSAPQQSVSLELPQKASSGLPLPAQMKMVLPATHPHTTLSSEQN